MALVVYDRVRETTSVTGTSDAALLGAVTGFQSFAVVGNGNTCYYTISAQGGSEWEVGIGTYNTTGPTLERTTILSSSNSNNKVVFSAGTKDIFLTYPASTSVNTDRTNTFTEPQVISTNSSTNALRITQTGSGNALVVEDSANPDSTPFVVDANGTVIVGSTSVVTGTFSSTPDIQINKAAAESRFGHSRFNNGVNGPEYLFQKSRGTSSGSQVIVQSGDSVGITYYSGSDGTSFIPAAAVISQVDGAPATGSMPGRLVFSTTASGSSTPTERMRITSAGNVGIGLTPVVTQSLSVGKIITGGTTAMGIRSVGAAQSDVTSAVRGFDSGITTAAASFTLSNLIHYYAAPAAFGAGSTVTNQIGYFAESNLTGATNNYGFFSNIASGTGRWNFYANGTADNFFAGKVGIGGIPFATTIQNISGTHPGTGTINYVFYTNAIAPATNTNQFVGVQTAIGTAAASFTLSELMHFASGPGSIGAGSTVTSQYGFNNPSTLTNATNNFGFRSDIAAATGRWNFYANGTAANYFAGSVGIGSLPIATSLLTLGGTTPSSSNFSNLINITGTIPSTTTATATGITSNFGTAAASFTLSNIIHFTANPAAFGAGSTVTNQFGFRVESSLTGAANNFGFYSNIASGSNRWNFYANGTAQNYFAGTTLVGTLTNTNSSILVSGGTISETVGSTQYLVASQYDVGSAPNQIPLNQYLGSMAFQDSNAVTTGLARLGVGTGQEALRAITTANSVNYVEIRGNTAGLYPAITATGTDATVGLVFNTKAGALHQFYTGSQLQFAISHTAATVNYLNVTGGGTGGAPVLSAQGSDTNISTIIRSKGTFACEFQSAAGNILLQALPVASSVNYFRVEPSATGSSPALSAIGSDTNINIRLTPKGTGRVQYGTHTATSDTAISGFIEILDAAGNVRKLAVIT